MNAEDRQEGDSTSRGGQRQATALQEIHIREYVAALLRRWQIIVGTCAAFIVVAAVYNEKAVPIYRAEALVMIDRRAPKVVDFEDQMRLYRGWQEYYETEARLIRSRGVAEAVVERLQLKTRKPFSGMKDPASAVTSGISVTRIERSRLFRIGYSSTDAEVAKDVAEAVVNEYARFKSGRWQSGPQNALRWLDERLPRLREALRDAESRLQKFQEENRLVADDKKSSVARASLAQISSELTNARIRRISFEAEYELARSAESDFERALTLQAVRDNPSFLRLQSMRFELEDKRIDLLKDLASDHQDVLTVDAQLQELDKRARKLVKSILEGIRQSYEAAKLREQMLAEQERTQKQEVLALNEKLIRMDALERDVERAKEMYEPLLARRNQASLSSELDPKTVHIVESPPVPTSPVAPAKTRNLLIAGILGLLLGFSLALLVEHFDDSIRSSADVSSFVGTAHLATIPRISRKKVANVLFSKKDEHGTRSFEEAFRVLRTNLALTGDGSPRAILITSAVSGEGKTTAASNLAAAISREGRRVLLIDADLRRPSIHNVLRMDNGAGLTEYLAGRAGVEDVIRTVEAVGFDLPENGKLDVVSSGDRCPTPAEMLGSKKWLELLAFAKENYDAVIMDSPPVMGVADVLVLAPSCDSVILIALAGGTSKRVVRHAREMVANARGDVAGVVLNSASVGSAYGYYGYYYDRYYYPSEPS